MSASWAVDGGWWEGRADRDGALGVGFEILLVLNGTANLFLDEIRHEKMFLPCVSNASGLPHDL